MESLNKNQIILLTLLISFVTSIATGIVTVTLMDQAPAGVTQTVNRVVERTIERVVPGAPVERTVVKEVPVQVTQEDLVQSVINDSLASVVRLTSADGVNLGSGFLASDDGLILTAAAILPSVRVGERYQVEWRNGDHVMARVARVDSTNGVAALQLDGKELAAFKQKLLAAAGAAATSTPAATAINWQPLSLLAGPLALGQTVVALGVPDSGPPNVALGIVSSAGETKTLRTNAANDWNRGGPIFNIKGQVIGLSQSGGLAAAVMALQPLLQPTTTQ